MAHKCTSRGCEFSLPDTYPLDKCPWHMVPGRGPVKIAAALAVAAAGLGGGLAYKKYKTYLHEKQLRKERKERRQRAAAASEQEQKARAVRNGAAPKSRKSPRKRKKADEIEAGRVRSIIGESGDTECHARDARVRFASVRAECAHRDLTLLQHGDKRTLR